MLGPSSSFAEWSPDLLAAGFLSSLFSVESLLFSVDVVVVSVLGSDAETGATASALRWCRAYAGISRGPERF